MESTTCGLSRLIWKVTVQDFTQLGPFPILVMVHFNLMLKQIQQVLTMLSCLFPLQSTAGNNFLNVVLDGQTRNQLSVMELKVTFGIQILIR